MSKMILEYDKFHLSISSQNTFNDCSRKWEYDKIHKIPRKTNLNLVLGISVDHAMDALIKGEDPILALDMYIDSMKPELTEQELDDLPDKHLALKTIIDEYVETLANDTEWTPIEVQYPVYMKIKGITRPIVGFIDMIMKSKDGQYKVIDHKTSSRKMSRLRYEYEKQIVTYGMFIKKFFQLEELPIMEVQSFTMTKTPSMVFHRVESEDAILVFEDVIEGFIQMEKAIRTGNYPKNRASMLCSSKFCDFYDVCHSDTFFSEIDCMIEEVNSPKPKQ